MASTSTHRPPLATLPLSHFSASSSSTLPFPGPPSPISLPSKRPAPASPGSSRKVSRTEKSGTAGSNSRRGSGEITPVVKKRLERDDLGVGKSPARRLFINEAGSSRSGVSGIIPTPSASQPPTLAPSPPLLPRTLSAPTPLTETDDNGVIRSIHDPGFPVHPDDPSLTTSITSSIHTAPPTPKSRRTNSTTPVEDFFPPSPSSTSSTRSARLDDQENIPPLFSTPSSTRSSPRKWNTLKSGSSASTVSSGYEEEETVIFGSGRGRNGRSKLVQVVLRQSSDPLDDDEGEELTPGKKGADPRGKERLAREADAA